MPAARPLRRLLQPMSRILTAAGRAVMGAAERDRTLPPHAPGEVVFRHYV
ncbi:hypothetical protein J2X36_004679 [Methylobacterium sp. BE186]|nr:hypothetical protein [Methylobacterium sp. BE186]MDR7039901.1 hypothetical protein [Methylobacterium sp. BE186]